MDEGPSKMIRDMREFVAEMREQIERWKEHLATIGTPDNPAEFQVAESLRSWIRAGEIVIATSGY